MQKSKEDKRGLLEHLQSSLHSLARNGAECEVPSLKFKWQNASPGTVVIEDPARSQFKLDEDQLDVLLTNFKLEGIGTSHIYQESIVMRGLQFAFKFQALSTQEIEATSSDYTVFMTGNQQKSIRQLPLTIKLFPEQIKLEALSAESRGYLNRLAKRAHINRSEYVYGQKPNLLKFVPSFKMPLAQLADIQREQQQEKRDKQGKMEIENDSYLEQLNTEGVNIIKRIHKVLPRRDIYNYVHNRDWRNPEAVSSITRLLEYSQEEQKQKR